MMRRVCGRVRKYEWKQEQQQRERRRSFEDESGMWARANPSADPRDDLKRRTDVDETTANDRKSFRKKMSVKKSNYAVAIV